MLAHLEVSRTCVCIFGSRISQLYNLRYLEAQHNYVAVPAPVRLGDENNGVWGSEWGGGSLLEAAVD